MHFSDINELQFRKERHTLVCISKTFTNIVDSLFLKNAWLPKIFFGFHFITLVKEARKGFLAERPRVSHTRNSNSCSRQLVIQNGSPEIKKKKHR